MRIEVTTIINQKQSNVWFQMVNWELYGRWIPLTKMINPEGVIYNGNVGEKFIGRTGISFLAFNDPMIVTESIPPVAGSNGFTVAKLQVLKTGKVVKGSAGFTLEPINKGEITKLTWWEDVEVLSPAFQKTFNWILEPVAKSSFQNVVNAIAKDLSRKNLR
jgi:hypothetical protein